MAANRTRAAEVRERGRLRGTFSSEARAVQRGYGVISDAE